MRNPYSAYLEEEVLSASPLHLVCLLYGKAIAEIRNARRFLAEGNIADRSAAISKACNVLAELLSSLNPESGGELAAQLGQLYTYSTARLLHANLHKDDAALSEVLGLLITLQESWEALALTERQPGIQMPAPSVYAAASAGEPLSHSWSL